MKYSHEYSDLGATMYANAAQLEAQVLKRKSVFMKLLQNQSKWLEFQKAATVVEELRVVIRQFTKSLDRNTLWLFFLTLISNTNELLLSK